MTAAPISAEALGTALAPLGSSTILPRAAYTDPAVLAWEQKNFFGGWLCVGRSEDVSGDVTQRALEVGGNGILLLRGEDGALRAFANACRHRGHELLPCGGTAGRRSVVCPYHAWSYDLGGGLRNAPDVTLGAAYDKSQLGLQELPLKEWYGWVFVAPGGEGSDFAAHVGDAEEVVTRYQAQDLRVVDSHEYVIESNWKVIVENYQECYHCPSIHPELCRISPPESGANITDGVGDWVGGWMDLRPGLQTMSMDGSSSSAAIATLNEHEAKTVMYLVLFPNLLLSLHPDYIMTHTLVPIAPDKTFVRCSWLFPQEAIAQDGFDPSNAVDFWDLTNRQDWAACESVQRGLRTEQWVPGPLAADEDGVYHFVNLIANRYVTG